MDAPQIKAFIDAMASSGLDEMEVAHEGWTLRLVRRPGVAASSANQTTVPRAARRTTAAAPSPAAESNDVCAPLFGIVHLHPSPGSPPFVSAGQSVCAGQTLAVIEAMKVFNEVHAERNGVVDAVMVDSGVEVEAGQPLLRWR
jgi:acetyl-CoA carboxylase biotin carboxyl carrier protein